MEKRGKRIFSLLAAILEYPTRRIIDQADRAIVALGFVNRAAQHHLVGFREFCRTTSLARLEQIYIRTFDLDAACCPSVGHHLFGQDRSRLLFAAKLKEEYVGHVVSDRHKNVPDHISVMLRSLLVQESIEEARELIACCLIPAAKKMISSLSDKKNPYRRVLQAVLLTLETEDRCACTIRSEQYA